MISLAAASSPRPSRLARFLTGGAVALVTGGLLATGLTTVASAAVTPNLTVHVQAGGQNVAGVDVEVYGVDDDYDFSLADARTNANGVAVFGNDEDLHVGEQYIVSITKSYDIPEGFESFTNGFLSNNSTVAVDDFADATPVVLTAGNNARTVSLQTGTTITGSIYSPEDELYDNSEQVTAFRKSIDPGSGKVRWIDEGRVGSSGSSQFEIGGLRAGNYVIGASQYLQSTWTGYTFNNGLSLIGQATPVAVSRTASTVIDATFAYSAPLSGHVSVPAGITIDSDSNRVWVSATGINPDGTPDTSGTGNYPGTDVNSDGSYAFTGLGAGSYLLQFGTQIEGLYGEWYDNAGTIRTATPVETGSSDIDATLGAGFSLTVNANSGNGPVAGATVTITPSDSYTPKTATSGANGKAVFPNLAPGDYRVEVQYPNDEYPSRYVTSDGVGTTNSSQLDLVSGVEGTVEAGVTFPGVSSNIVTITDPAGKPVTSAYIQAIRVNNGAPVYGDAGVTPTKVAGKSGVYSFALESNVDYTILVDSYPSTTVFAQYLGGVPAYGDDAIANATTFNSGTGGAFSFKLAGSGTITGKVTSTTKKALASVYVNVYEYNGKDWIRSTSASTSKTGAYTVPVRPGSYKVGFSTQGGPSNTYVGDDIAGNDLDTLATVYVGKNASATVNKSLVLGGSITGTVANAAGVVTPRVYVTAVKIVGGVASPSAGNYGFTSSKGVFSITGLPTGTYALSFDDNYEGRVGDTFVKNGTVVTYAVTAGKATKIASKIVLPAFQAPRTAIVSGALTPAVPGVNGFVDFISTDSLHYGRAEFTGAGAFSIGLIPGDYDYTVTFGNSNAVEYRPLTGSVTASAGQNTIAVQAIENNPLTFDTAPTITASGTAVGASSLQVTASYDHDRAQARYQWLRDGLPIFGATDATYVPTGGDAGAIITARVTIDNKFYLSSEDYQSAVATTAGIQITLGAAIEITEDVSVTATNRSPGGIASVVSGWLPAGATPSYAWYRDGEAIEGANRSTYTLLATDIGSTISAHVTAKRVGRAPSGEAISTGIVVEKNAAPTVVKKPTVTSSTTGLPAGSTTYTVNPGTFSVTGTTPVYTWYRDAEQLDVIGNTYTAAATTSAIWVTVTATKDGYEPSAAFALLVRKASVATTPDFTPFVQNLDNGDAVTATSVVTLGTPLGAAATFTAPAGGTTAPTYVWQRLTGTKWTAIAKATASIYTVTAADAGKSLRVIITSTAPYYAARSYTIDAGVGALRSGLVQERAGSVSISGTGAVSSTVSAVVAPHETPITGVKVAYQWGTTAGDVFTPIAKATKATFVVPAALLGKELAVRVTATKAEYATSVETSNSVTVTTGTLTVVTPVALGGHAGVDDTLIAKPAVVDVTGTTRSYSWQYYIANEETWATIAGANSATYIPKLSDQGKLVRVVELIEKAGFESVTSTSSHDEIYLGFTTIKTAPKVTTTTTKYTVSAGASTPATTPTYEWTVGGEPTGNTTATYTRTSGDAGKLITVTVRYDLPGHYTAKSYLVAQKGVAVKTSELNIYNAHVGSPVSRDGGAIDFPAGSTTEPTVTFQWLLAGKAIKGATSTEYTPIASQLGKKLSWTITVSSTEYAPVKFTSNAVTVEKGFAPEVGVFLDEDQVVVGATVAGYVDTVQAGFTVGYQWYRSTGGSTPVAISKATKISYTTVAADADSELSLRVTYTRAGFESKTYTVGTIGVLGVDGLTPIASPELTGTGAVATELSVSAGTWTVAPTLSYQWLRNDIPIPGATTSKYTPLGGSLSDAISVVVTAKRAGFHSFVVQTNEIRVIAGAAPTIVGTAVPTITGTSASCSTLTASTGTWTGDGLTYRYQWYRLQLGSKQLIAGATASTYTVSSADVGYQMQAIVTAHSTGYATGISSANAPTVVVEGCAG